jgi:simple sugar transport system ATP-binding protein
MRAMVDDGMSVVLITHKIRETLSVCDRMTVMRDGRRVETIERADTDAEHLAEKMVGSSTDPGAGVDAAALGAVDAEKVEETLSSVGTATAVAVRDLVVVNDQGHELIRGFDLELREGEIVGIAGVAGNGQVELAEALAGVRQLRAGTVEVTGRSMGGLATSAWLEHGIAYVPEDRHRDGILPTASITENLVLGSQRSAQVRKRGLIDWGAAKQRAVDAIAEFSVRANGPGTLVGDLSGGNIQRVILARAFARQPRMLILHNPTRGLDIGSTRFVYQQVRKATAAGCAVLLISEDLDEVIALSDRVIALYQGSKAGEWQHGSVDSYAVGRSMTGLGEARV